MARRARVYTREQIADAKYNSLIVANLIKKVMKQGRKRTAENIAYDALEILAKQVNQEAVPALEQAIKNATPLLEVKPRRVGGATYQVPVEVPQERGVFLALQWLLDAARGRKGKSMAVRLAGELADAWQNQGTTIKKREDTHKMAEANRAFAHYRW